MGIVIAAVAAGSVGLAAAFVGVIALLRQKNRVGRRADHVSAADPALAEELRQVQAQIAAGSMGYRL
ncbi:MAG: hypothetical protein EPO52_12325 [Herbiconiux sp.]|uniref:hypothetical protein n=1 Tax=Herbiconiux sp. TaxID=1871186 RepID=UPI00120F6380|nr:hypothetical protein [Herbiconiux sp.]TAJ47281.1 MAG: hypothetical protein EPO52_12325 [Herbiconiux sp.]